MTTRAETLGRAHQAVNGERDTVYGRPEDNFAHIAALWSCHLGHPVTAIDVALMMVLLKVARQRTTPNHEDGWIDIAGYAACGAEITHAPGVGVRAVSEALAAAVSE